MTSEAWTPLRLIAWTQGFFAKGGVDAPRLTAEILLAHALRCDRVRLYLDFDKPLGEAELAAYRELVRRRAAGEPTAWLTGRRAFLGHDFRVDARVLVPRPETELVVEAALALLPPGGALLDLCTGTGCIALSAALSRPDAERAPQELAPTREPRGGLPGGPAAHELPERRQLGRAERLVEVEVEPDPVAGERVSEQDLGGEPRGVDAAASEEPLRPGDEPERGPGLLGHARFSAARAASLREASRSASAAKWVRQASMTSWTSPSMTAGRLWRV